MSYKTPVCVLALLLPALAACGPFSGIGQGGVPEDVAVRAPQADTTRPQARQPGTQVASLGQTGLRPEALDQVSAEERAAALAPASASTQPLGETLAALGSPAQTGLWLRTGLVTSVT
ncbi:MAG: hypothetical protein ACNA7L_11765, partial [Roseinatronobacter sp.]